MSSSLKITLPNEWNFVKIKDISKMFIGGGTPSTKNKEYWNGNIPWMTSAILVNMYINEGMRNISEIGLKNSSSNLVPKESIIISTRVGIGKVGIAGIDIAINQDLTGIIIDQDKALPEYIYWILSNSKNKLFNLSQGTTVRGIERQSLENLKILLPSIKEQYKINSILSNVNNLIINTQKIIENLQILIKGLMHRLFTEGIKHTEFKETRLGKTPKEWEIVTISKIGKVIGGGTPDTRTEKYWNGHIAWATPTDITNLNKKFITKTNRNISIEGLNNSSAKLLPPFSLLMTSRASIGYCAINTREMCTNQGFQSVIPNKDIDVEFLYYLILSSKLQNQLVRFAYGSTFLEIPNKDAKKIKIPLPKLDEQKKIISILSSLDKKIMIENQNASFLKKIKKGIMQELLTGKKSVTTN